MWSSLFDATDAETRVEATIEAAFQEFHRAHPEVYLKLRELALEVVTRGHAKHLGIGMLWETLRYYTLLGAGPDEDAFRLNNNYRSRYARMLMMNEPELEGVFETRTLRSA
jgi:hypothetical protein